MATDVQRSNIDSVLTYILIKKLLTPITQTKAYQLGLVDRSGKTTTAPVTSSEKDALTILDRLVFKLKRLLGTKLTVLNKFLYVITIGSNFYNNLIVKGNVDQRGEILRIKKDINSVTEKYNITLDDYLIGLLNEEVSKEI